MWQINPLENTVICLHQKSFKENELLNLLTYSYFDLDKDMFFFL